MGKNVEYSTDEICQIIFNFGKSCTLNMQKSFYSISDYNIQRIETKKSTLFDPTTHGHIDFM